MLKNQIQTFSTANFIERCDSIFNNIPALQQILLKYGYPPLWKRPATFESIVHIILEQQVSLESAKAAYNKLQEKIQIVAPLNILQLQPNQLKACYITKQKASYLHALSQAVLENQLNIPSLAKLADNEVKTELEKIKGIGNWTSSIYLMMCLQRSNCFPMGDVALITSFREHIKPQATKNEIEEFVNKFSPNKTMLAFILWWGYLKKRNRSISSY